MQPGKPHSHQPQSLVPARQASKRTESEQTAEPTQSDKGTGHGKSKASKAQPAPQPYRWLGRDYNATLNMQHTGQSDWRPLELCSWIHLPELLAKVKEFPDLGYN
ncbi:hypothetical protein QJQ45_010613 [Haematococcus lacustris]|nr:hypothetical protein QJQ45_010613 [Haematococcus lacustris]